MSWRGRPIAPDPPVGAAHHAGQPNAVVRRYRGEPAPLVRSGDGSWRSGRLDAVLRGNFDLLGADEEPPQPAGR